MTNDGPLPSDIAAIRARLIALDAAHASGALDDATWKSTRRDVERALSDAVLALPTAMPTDGPASTALATSVIAAPRAPRSTRPSRRLVAVLALVVVIVAIGGYALTGSPSLVGVAKAPPVTDNAATGDREIGLQEIAGMVDRLAARLKERPDDAEGWTMLARSYTVLGRYRDAQPAYRRAIELHPQDAGLVADYADAVAAANGGKSNAESIALVERSLAIDPAQPKALALAGTVAFERGDYATAVMQWQKIADALPPDSEFHKQVMANIDEARHRGGIAAPIGRPAPAAVAIASGREALSGTVSLAPALASTASPNDTVFVLARPQSGRMPLAVFRATVKDLPLHFKLDDSMAMTPTMKISDMKHVIVAARVSKSGNAISQPGDLSGETGPVAPGTADLSIVIGNVVGAR